MMTEFRSGSRPTTQIGFVNDNGQKCLGTRGEPGNHCSAKAYKMQCTNCGHIYGANGCDVWDRQCPGPKCKKSNVQGPDF